VARQSKEARIVIISMLADDDEAIITALHCGARGLVLKMDSAQKLLDVLRAVAHGGSCFNEQAPNHMNFQRRDVRRNGPSSLANGLTMRELEVFHLVTAGHSSREIALRLSLSVETIRSYRKSMMRKLGAKHVAGLIQVGVEAGLTRWTRRPAGRHN
jgi:DNA-binding NarL/FixJ family response regulator